jgi:ABC-type lipoprotein export system ATPase subunit
MFNILGGLDRDRKLTEFCRRRVGFIFQFYNLIPSRPPART